MALTEGQAADAVRDWALEAVPDLGVPRTAPGSSWPLPDVAVALRRSTRGKAELEQALEARRTVDLIVAVDPEPVVEQSRTLYGYMETLMGSLLADTTFGGRAHLLVPSAEPVCTVEYGEAETDLDDGSSALVAVLSFTMRDVI